MRIKEAALKKWAENDLVMTQLDNGAYEAAFAYRGSNCRNGGMDFDSIMRILLQPENGDWRIADVTINIDPEDEGWQKTCIHQSSMDPSTANIAKNVSARGMMLNEFLGRKWADE